MSDGLALIELLGWYKRMVLKVTAELPDPPAWYYGRFRNGVSIPKPSRVAFRSRIDTMARFSDPFDTEPGSFYQWLQSGDATIFAAAS